MKHFKILLGTLLVLFSLTSNAGTYKYSAAQAVDKMVQSIPYCASKNAQAVFYDAYLWKKRDIHYKIKNKVRARATAAESSIFITPYYLNLLRFIIYESSLLYGITTIYQIKRCTYLHLYQLF
ncbi:hypothetical protein ACHRV1_25770 [Flavobacterium aquidurense]|uniref:Uncharacterized protein n=1 Tax=Flavobacterium piscisymbiosum TaxID=2893753 RepID=A0ABS8MHR5_9FLAO|nr:hypothetical protein [Flavobacterium sp. F-30]MCC9065027.1 hypothetical protein [Flavobacterium sp. F-30]